MSTLLRAWGVKMAVLLVAVLAAIGAWEVFRGTVMPGRAVALDGFLIPSFKCYDISPKASVKQQIFLSGQFRNEDVEVNQPKLLCTPTNTPD